MTWGVCLEYTAVEQFRRAWGYVVQECEVPHAWERNTDEGMDHNIWKDWHFGATVLDIPAELSLVVLTPFDGSKLQGWQSLYSYVHPEKAVYYFGSDQSDLRHEDLLGREYETVFIPEGGFMHSFCAAPIVIYDRRSKQWQS